MSNATVSEETGIIPVSRGSFQTLADIVQTLIEMSEMLETATNEERPVIEEELQRMIGVDLANKVDGLACFDKRCNAEVEILKDFIAEAQKHIDSWEKRKKRIRDLAKWSMAKLAITRIKGRMHSISVRAGAESLKISNEELVPKRFKVVEASMPSMLWDALVSALPPEVAAALALGATTSERIDNAAVKAALKGGEDVPGAWLQRGDEILTVR